MANGGGAVYPIQLLHSGFSSAWAYFTRVNWRISTLENRDASVDPSSSHIPRATCRSPRHEEASALRRKDAPVARHVTRASALQPQLTSVRAFLLAAHVAAADK